MKEVKGMKEYEIIIETINPCGGDRHSQQEIVEAKIESPEAFVKEKGRFPIIDKIEVVRRGKARRAKLFYLRDRVGKAAKVKEIVK